MADEPFTQNVFAQVRAFGWDPAKRQRNLQKHDIDFDDARSVLDGAIVVRRSDRHGEIRYMVFGFLDDIEVVVVCTIRGTLCWIISARRARQDERKKYHSRLPRRSPEGKD